MTGGHRRVLVAGSTGSGKTTLARRLAAIWQLPHTELDGLWHGPGWRVRPEFDADVDALVARPTWVTEYQYRSAKPRLLAAADLVVWLDHPWPLVAGRLLARTVRRVVTRAPLYNGNRERWAGLFRADHPLRVVLSPAFAEKRARTAEEFAAAGVPVVRLRGRRGTDRWMAEQTAAAATATGRGAAAAGRGQDAGMTLVDRIASRVLGLPEATSTYTVERGLRVPMRDGVQLLADRYVPDGPVRGTLLVRGPYGRAFPFSLFFATAFAARGYQVVFQSVRGTYGSGDEFQPMFREVDDGADTVAWLRDQPWFTGTFGTVGLSYLGFTQWALLADPPEELVASVVLVGPHDFSRATWGTGAFTVNDFLGWSDLVAHQEDPGRLRGLVRQVTSARRLGPALDALPLGDAGERLLDGRARWYRDWVAHPDRTDPWWRPVQLDRALDRSRVPVLLIGGWQDLFLGQTLEQYRRLRDAGADVALTVGPWTHVETLSRGGGLITRESLDWLGRHLAAGSATDSPTAEARPAPVHVHVTGAGEWRWLPDWPPAGAERTLHLAGGGRLTDTAPGPDAAPATFVADPAEPTPSFGGRLLDNRSGGYTDDTVLADRDDVAAWVSDPLPADLELLGRPVVELHHGSDVGHVDIAVRLSQVDRRGRSRNVSDGYVRLVPGDPGTDVDGGTVRLELDAVAHRFPAGSRLRLVVAGSSHPHYARNTGTGEPPETAVRTVRSTRTVRVAGGASRLLLPVGGEVSPAGRTPGPASRG